MNIVGDFKQGVCYDWGMDGKLDGMTVSNAQGGVSEIRFEWERGRPAGWNVGDPFQNFEPYFQVFQRDSWRPWLVAGALGGKPGPRGTPPDFTFSYAYDALGRPVSRSGDAFAYDARGEVTNATISSAAMPRSSASFSSAPLEKRSLSLSGWSLQSITPKVNTSSAASFVWA